MRKMIKWIAFVMVLAMTVLLLCSCGGGELVGTWKCYAYERGTDTIVEYQDAYIVLNADGGFTAIKHHKRPDGTYSVEEIEGTYVVEGDRLMLTDPEYGVSVLIIEEKDGKIILSDAYGEGYLSRD